MTNAKILIEILHENLLRLKKTKALHQIKAELTHANGKLATLQHKIMNNLKKIFYSIFTTANRHSEGQSWRARQKYKESYFE